MKINKGQFLEDIMNSIPTNCILYKILTGIRATSLMLGKLNLLVNLVLIVPNVPVIKGKCAFYNTRKKQRIKGVYEGVTIDSIIEYLNSDVTPKKIITTPESYYKVREAIEEHPTFDLYSDFFMLFDECERLVQDVAFRDKMLMPMHDFFQFDKKALISATPIPLSDPRFEEQNFKNIVLEPTFDYSKDITLIETNNIELSLAKFIKDNPREHYFVFHNTTDSIGHLIRRLEMKDDSAVFCARDSRAKLRGNGFKNVHIEFVPFEKNNFLTSRFFSAVDINLEKHPTIIMLTDLLFAEHSTIDPLSEAIQIIGRFRETKDFVPQKEIIHITNFNPDTYVQSDAEILKDIDHGQHVHKYLKAYLKGATTRGAIKVLTEMMNKIESSLCITSEGDINHYLKDNRFFEEKVKGYYLNAANLIAAYKQSKHFNVQHKIEEYNFTDKDRIKLIKEKGVRIKSMFEILTPVMIDLANSKDSDPFGVDMELKALRKHYPKEIKLLEDVGLEEAKRLKFNVFAIREAVNKKQTDKELFNFEFIDYLDKHIQVGEIYTSKEIRGILYRGIKRFKLFKLRANLNLISLYYKLSDDRKPAGKDENGKHQKGYLIEKRLVP